jgi:hypothetical protein
VGGATAALAERCVDRANLPRYVGCVYDRAGLLINDNLCIDTSCLRIGPHDPLAPA